jgi:hypothetical protein
LGNIAKIIMKGVVKDKKGIATGRVINFPKAQKLQ